MKNLITWVAIVGFGIFLTACDSKPQRIENQPPIPLEGSHAFPQTEQGPAEMHEVVVVEVLDASSYTYLLVKENEEPYWIAVPRREVEIGKTYYYKDRLLQQNFASKEHDRVFESLYLVGGISEEADGSTKGGSVADSRQENTAPSGPINVELAEGAIALSELMANTEKYGGKVIKVTGKCTKVNAMIMNRNWVHIKDGSSKTLELIVTTNAEVQVGSVVTFEGTITLNKDFGAGYRYDVIMEDAVVR